MRKATKSQLAKELETAMAEHNNHNYSNGKRALVIDGMSFIQTVKGSGTFGIYAAQLLDRVLKEGEGFERIDIVFDVYHPQINQISRAGTAW